jgi:hypothetical protein
MTTSVNEIKGMPICIEKDSDLSKVYTVFIPDVFDLPEQKKIVYEETIADSTYV